MPPHCEFPYHEWMLNLLAAGVFAIVMPATAGQANAGADAYALLQQNRFSEAEAMLQPLLRRSPESCSLRTMLGIAQQGENRIDEAYATFYRAAKQCPQSLPALEGAAQIAYAQQKPEASALLQRILALRPEDATTHAMLAATEARTGDCRGAVANYREAGPQLDQNVSALRQYAGCLLATDDKPQAVSTLGKVVALDDAADARILLARLLQDMGNHADALTTLQPLTDANSQNFDALLLAAQIYESQNETPQAVTLTRQAIQAAPKNVDGYIFFAALSITHGSYQVGVDLVNVGLSELPGNARLLLARGVLEVQLSKLDAALVDFESAHRADPKLSFVDDAMGALFSQKHDNADALTVFAAKVKEDPKDPLLQYLYAEALSEDGSSGANGEQTETAIKAAKRAIESEPSYTPARDLLCVLLMRHGDLQEVVATAEEATRREPYDESALYQEVIAERRLKHTERAQQLVQRLEEVKRHNQQGITKYVLSDQTSAVAPAQ